MADQQQHHHDIELNEDASTSTNTTTNNSKQQKQQHSTANEHGTKNESPVAVKWFINGNWRRFMCHQWTYSALLAELQNIDPNFNGQLFYLDSHDNAIVFSTDVEMREMLNYFRSIGRDTVTIQEKGDVITDIEKEPMFRGPL